MISYFNIYTVHLKCFASIRYLLNETNQGLNSDRLVWNMSKSKHQKQQYLFLISSFDSIRYNLNQYKTLTNNFNQGLNSGELVWKMAKSKHQKQH